MAAGQTRTASEHRRRLIRAREVARTGVDEPAPARLERVRDLAGRGTTVDLGSQRVDLAGDPLLAALEGDNAADFRTAAAHLDLLIDEVDAVTAGDQPDPARLRAALGHAYREVDPAVSWRRRLGRVLNDVVARIVASAAGAGDLLRVVATVMVIGGVTAGAVWLVRRMTVVGDERRQPMTGDGDSTIDWRQRATDAQASGDLEAALRARFRLLVAALDARGVVEDAPSLTPAECRGAVAGPDSGLGDNLVGAVRRATNAVETVVYGDRPADRRHLEAVRHAESRLTS